MRGLPRPSCEPLHPLTELIRDACATNRATGMWSPKALNHIIVGYLLQRAEWLKKCFDQPLSMDDMEVMTETAFELSEKCEKPKSSWCDCVEPKSCGTMIVRGYPNDAVRMVCECGRPIQDKPKPSLPSKIEQISRVSTKTLKDNEAIMCLANKLNEVIANQCFLIDYLNSKEAREGER